MGKEEGSVTNTDPAHAWDQPERLTETQQKRDEFGVITVRSQKYGALLARSLPKVIETEEELERFSEIMESLDRLDRPLTPEERALETLLAKLIQDYDDQIELPEVPPHKIISFLMEHKELCQTDLLPDFRSRSVASDVIGGKRGPSKAHIRKLAEFFHISPELFL